MVGSHLANRVSQAQLAVLARWRPAAITLFNEALHDAAAVRAVAPHATITGRTYKPDHEIEARIEANPLEAAGWLANIVLAAPGRGSVNYWQAYNENMQVTSAKIAKLSICSIEYMRRLEAAGLKAAIGCFGVGNPKTLQEDASHWQAFYPAMRHALANGHILLLHAYGKKTLGTLTTQRAWLINRFELQVWPHLPADLKTLPYVYGEYGNDELTYNGPKMGWKGPYNLDHNLFIAELQEAIKPLQGKPCRGAAVYTDGFENGEWEPYDIRGACSDAMSRTVWPEPATSPPPPPPPPPPPEEPDMSLEQWLIEQGNNAAVVPVSPGQAVFDAIIGDGNIPNGPEVYATYPTSGQKYALRSGEHPTVASGAKWTYYVPVPAPGQPWPGVQRVLRSGTPVQPLPIAPSLIPYPSPNSGPRPGDFDAIVLHATAGPLGPSLAWLTNPASEASTHYLIAKDGRIFQMVPDHLRAWHAGASAHAGRADWNDFSLGVEIVNQNNGADPYPAAQVASLISLLRWLVWQYDIAPDDLVTHAQVAVPPGRKSDPKGLALGYIKSEVYP